MTDKTFSDLMSEISASDTFQKFIEDPEQLITTIVSDEDGIGVRLYKYANTKAEPLSEDKIKATIYNVR